MSKYMHTLQGLPATFDGYQICFASFYGKPNKLVRSLHQIRREQQITLRNRARNNLEYDIKDYGYYRYE